MRTALASTAIGKVALAFGGGVAIASAVFLWTGREPAVAPQPSAQPPAVQPVAVIEPVADPVPEPAPAKQAVAKPKPRPQPAAAPAPPNPAPEPVTQPQTTPEPEVIVAAPPPDEPTPPVVAADEAPAPIPSLPSPVQTVTLKQGTLLSVLLDEGLSSERNALGDTFRASLDEPLVIDGWVIAERGARVLGRIRDMDQPGRVKGLASMTLELTRLDTADGQRIDLRTAGFVHKARESKRNDAVKVGIGAVIGAALGAAIGGGKGAAIGAASGGAAGAGAVVATKGDAAVLNPETRIRFRVDRPVEITERR